MLYSVCVSKQCAIHCSINKSINLPHHEICRWTWGAQLKDGLILSGLEATSLYICIHSMMHLTPPPVLNLLPQRKQNKGERTSTMTKVHYRVLAEPVVLNCNLQISSIFFLYLPQYLLLPRPNKIKSLPQLPHLLSLLVSQEIPQFNDFHFQLFSSFFFKKTVHTRV